MRKCHLLEFSHLMRRIPRPKIGSELSMGVQSHGTAGAGSRDQHAQGSLYGSHHPWTATLFPSDSHESLYNWNSELFSVFRPDDLSLGHKEHSPQTPSLILSLLWGPIAISSTQLQCGDWACQDLACDFGLIFEIHRMGLENVCSVYSQIHK